MVDPHGALTVILTSENNQISWKNQLAGYHAPKIELVEVNHPSVPIISLILWIAVLMIVVISLLRKKKWSGSYLLLLLAGVGFICFPFIRFQVDLPLLPQRKPSKEGVSIIMEGLLANVYHAFDRRDEARVYDRLALSVTGEQLTDIYIQNRQSMAMENRGGARAKVDEVKIQELFNIQRIDKGAFIADLSWTVRGSVNHFGHTHYRQNQYRALVSFIDENNIWKINDIETLDERRNY